VGAGSVVGKSSARCAEIPGRELGSAVNAGRYLRSSSHHQSARTARHALPITDCGTIVLHAADEYQEGPAPGQKLLSYE